MIIERKYLQSVLDLGGSVVISPDWHINYLTVQQSTPEVLEVLRSADWAVLEHDTLLDLREGFVDTRSLADHLNDFYGLERTR